MLLLDVNVLIYSHREDSTADHPRYATWLKELAAGQEPFALSVLALAGLVSIVTNPRIFKPASTLDQVFAFTAELVQRSTARVVAPGPAHLAIFEELCRDSRAEGKLVADAQHAAVAIEHAARWSLRTQISTAFLGSVGSTLCVLESDVVRQFLRVTSSSRDSRACAANPWEGVGDDLRGDARPEEGASRPHRVAPRSA
ncbi:MAG TPA: TA system VapC family ribonuclease toxin [Vicinamibacteria bacterium]|nr:TA system VapC family ribonuclease toxin [Vicinamibacteria bacterium]